MEQSLKGTSQMSHECWHEDMHSRPTSALPRQSASEWNKNKKTFFFCHLTVKLVTKYTIKWSKLICMIWQRKRQKAVVLSLQIFLQILCTLYTQWVLDGDDLSLCLSGLRQDYVSTPAAALWRSSESPAMLSSYSKTTLDDVDDFTPGSKTQASSSSLWRPSLLSLSFSASSSSSSSTTSAATRSCQSQNLVRLHQQVTQYKLLKLAQGQGTVTFYFVFNHAVAYCIISYHIIISSDGPPGSCEVLWLTGCDQGCWIGGERWQKSPSFYG